MTVPSLTPTRIAEAVLYAARENPDSHVAEREFAARLNVHPRIIEARVGRIRHVMDLLRVSPGDVVLDVGSGIGLNSVLALLCGAGEVHSVEMTEDRLRSARLIARHLGVEDRIHIHGTDVLALDLPAGSVNAAFSFELLEHVRDVGGLYARLAEWLAPGARVYGRTGANGRNLAYRVLFARAWDTIDRENYVAIREEVVRRIAPDAPDGDVRILVARTRGELLPEIERIALEYRRNGALPPPKAPCAPRDPATGQYMERLLEPERVVRVMDAQGFRTEVVAPSFENVTTVRPLLAAAIRGAGAIIRAAHPVSLWVAPWLEFLSVRDPAARIARRGGGDGAAGPAAVRAAGG
jgi:predicted O-methyltransferase YrrM